MESSIRSVAVMSAKLGLVVIAMACNLSSSDAQHRPEISSTAQASKGVKNVPLNYHVIKRIEIGNCGGDTLAVDPINRHLFGACDKVLNIDDYSFVGTLPPNTGFAYALASNLGRGLTRRGLIFDLESLQERGTVPIHGDEMAFDSRRGLAFALGQSTSVVDILRGTVVGQVDLNARPEGGVADDRGHLYVNIPGAIVVVDTRTLKIEERWPVKGSCGLGLSLDSAHRRLFVSCTGQIVVVDADTGRAVATVPTPRTGDETAFDPDTQLLFSPNEGDDDGKVTIIHEDSPDQYSVVQTVTVGKCHDDLTIDPRTHRVFLYSLSPFTVIVLSPEPKNGT